MKKEKHYVNKTYGGHKLSRYVDIYEVSTDRCHSVPESGYKGTEATLVDDPAWNEKFSSYSITGATLTGNNFVINNDVTAQAIYETAKNVTLQTDGHGTIASTKNSGFINDTATLSNTASSGYGFSGYSITGATLTGNNFKFTGSDITAKAWFSALPPPSAVLYSDSTLLTGSNWLSADRKFTKDINQALTGFNYYVIAFDKRTDTRNSCVCIEPVNWSAKPIDGHVGVRGQVYFYPVSNVSRVVENNIPYWYNSAYNEGTWHRFKLLINKVNSNGRPFVNNVDCGYGNLPGSTTGISKITFHLIARESTFSARNFKIAGFNNFTDAYDWNG